MLYCGTSNIVLPVKNKNFYPPAFREGTRLTYYASIFNSLEVNQTFYKLPLAKTIARWNEETPAAFRFSMKLGKEITHNKDLQFEKSTVTNYMRVFNAIGAKKGCLLIQFPAGTKANAFERVKFLMECIEISNEGWKLALEFRDKSWYQNKVYDLLEQHNALLVQHDMPKSATPGIIPKSDTCYFRFHGVSGDYRGSYDKELLQQYVIKARQANEQNVYAYFNNTLGDAVHNAITMQVEYENYYAAPAKDHG